MDAVKREQQPGPQATRERTARRSPRARPRHADRGTVLRRAARRDGRRRRQDRAARPRATSCARSARSPSRRRTPIRRTRCSGRSRGAAGAASPSTCAAAAGQDLFRRLAATADVVVENFRPGTLERWNIAPGDLDPRLVVVRISSFGQDGPNSQRPGLDRVGIGYGGLLHLTGYPDRPPVRVGVTISDYLTGVFASQAALGALYRARRAARAARAR